PWTRSAVRNHGDDAECLVMRMRFATALLVLTAPFVLAGCKRAATPVAVADDPDRHLPEKSEISLADWLNLPRPELAQRLEDWQTTAGKLLDVRRGDRQSVVLLSVLRPVLTVPVFQHARFSQRSGLSLPPYLAEGEKDPEIALHLARHGDADG